LQRTFKNLKSSLTPDKVLNILYTQIAFLRLYTGVINIFKMAQLFGPPCTLLTKCPKSLGKVQCRP